MAKQRSPNYPLLTLEEAIERARQVYGKEHTHPAAREVVASDLGYTSLNGKSLGVIGALRRYGLLEDSGDGLRVSEDAVTILELPDTDNARLEAIRRAAFAPTLFSEMGSQFNTNLPSEANLRHWLIKRGFLSKASDEVIRIYRDNLKLVGTREERYNGADHARDGEADMQTQAPLATVGQAQVQKPVPVGVRSYSFALSPETKAELSIHGNANEEELGMLRDYIDITIRALARAKKAEA